MSQHFAVGGSKEWYGPTCMFSLETERVETSTDVDRRRLRYTVCEQKTKKKKYIRQAQRRLLLTFWRKLRANIFSLPLL